MLTFLNDFLCWLKISKVRWIDHFSPSCDTCALLIPCWTFNINLGFFLCKIWGCSLKIHRYRISKVVQFIKNSRTNRRHFLVGPFFLKGDNLKCILCYIHLCLFIDVSQRLDLFLLVMFYGFYHGSKLQLFTAIWENMFDTFSRHGTKKSKNVE